jgi:hypothetical protein
MSLQILVVDDHGRAHVRPCRSKGQPRGVLLPHDSRQVSGAAHLVFACIARTRGGPTDDAAKPIVFHSSGGGGHNLDVSWRGAVSHQSAVRPTTWQYDR